MNLRQTSKLIQDTNNKIAKYKELEERAYNSLRKQIGISDDDCIVFDYVFNGPGSGMENAMKVARLTRETQIPKASEPIS